MGKLSRRDEILQALATMLETKPGTRITTAALAAHVGVSGAALYRHFPSKAKMFDALIEFIEDSLLPRVNRIATEQPNIDVKCHDILQSLLMFAERNPGFARLLMGDALLGENERLRGRIRQLFNRLETELRGVLRSWAAAQVPAPPLSANDMANLLLASAEGRINQFVRSEFTLPPTQGWKAQWQLLGRKPIRQSAALNRAKPGALRFLVFAHAAPPPWFSM